MESVPFLNLQAINVAARTELIAAFTRVLESGWYINGREVDAFECEFSHYVGTRNCVGVGNGQRLRPAAASSNSIHSPATGFHPDQVLAEVVECLVKLLLAGVTDRKDADHRTDANADSEHGQCTAQFVSRDGPESFATDE